VLGLFGGYVSCSGDANAPLKGTWMERYLGEVQQGLKKSGAPEAKYIISCFKLDVSRVVFMTSDKPSEVREDSLSQLFSTFEASVNKLPGTSVSIVGHSYGGWLSLSLLDQVKTKFNVDSLTTLDPISRSQCTPPDVVNSFLGAPPFPGCTRAPADFDAAKLTDVKQRTKTWLNFYQTDSRLLHSGQLLGAQNIKRNYSPGDHEAHSKIPEDPEVVKEVTALMLR
jgi:pimeloyl-ACP methyl ester carboxylesterase